MVKKILFFLFSLLILVIFFLPQKSYACASFTECIAGTQYCYLANCTVVACGSCAGAQLPPTPTPPPPPPNCTPSWTCNTGPCNSGCGGTATYFCSDGCGNVTSNTCQQPACPTPTPKPGVVQLTCNSQGQWAQSCVSSCTPFTPTPNCDTGESCSSCGVECGQGLANCQYTRYSGGGSCRPVSFSKACSKNCPQGQLCVQNACKQGYSITGNVFVDANGNTIKDANEVNYSGGININSSGGTVTTAAGAYTVSGLLSGTYSVSYNNLPTGYSMTVPLNGPPPSWTVSVGPSCSENSPDASCLGGSVLNLNFGITNNKPWIQGVGSNMRIDSGFIDKIPATAVGGAYAVLNSSGGTPGLVFSGASAPDFGQGRASTTNWTAGGLSYPETYSPIKVGGQIKTSYNYLLSRAQQGNITPADLTAYCSGGLGNCTLGSLPHGIYKANGDLTLNAYSFPAGEDFIILVNGNLTIKGRIQVPVGTTAFFASLGNITVDKSVGEAPSSAFPSIAGIYSAGQSFIIDGTNDCTKGQDLRLNIGGTVITNANLGGGTFQMQRDLCQDDPSYPSAYIFERPDFIINTPAFLKTPNFTYQEIAP